MKKLEIHSSDIMKLNGKSASTARKQIQDVKKSLKKLKHQKVSIKEYCEYFGFDILEVSRLLFGAELKKVS